MTQRKYRAPVILCRYSAFHPLHYLIAALQAFVHAAGSVASAHGNPLLLQVGLT